MRNFFFLLMMSLASPACLANSCMLVNPLPVISFSGTIRVDPAASIGSAIATGKTQATISSIAQGAATNAFMYANTIVSGVSYTANGANVQPTNLTGVGIAVWGDSVVPKGTTSSLQITTPNGGTVTVAYNIYYALVKTASTASSGKVNSAVFSRIISTCLGNPYQQVDITDVNISITGGASVSNKACKVGNASIDVPLDTVKRSAFTGTGSTANARDFSISLTCSTASKISMTLAAGSSGAFSTTDGVVNLSKPTTGTKAEGVGIQLLYKGVAAPLGKAISVGSAAASSTFAIPLAARYYQTASTVTAGVANGTATFTMTYN